MDLPRPLGRPRPSHWSVPPVFVLVGCQRGAEGEVDPAVAVDVVRLDADVVALGGVLDDVVLRPARVRVPDDRVLGHGHDVGLAVAVDVGRRHRVADVADVRVDLLGLEPGEFRPGGEIDTENSQHDCEGEASHGTLRKIRWGSYIVSGRWPVLKSLSPSSQLRAQRRSRMRVQQAHRAADDCPHCRELAGGAGRLLERLAALSALRSSRLAAGSRVGTRRESLTGRRSTAAGTPPSLCRVSRPPTASS